MRLDVVTIFPEYLEPLNVSLVGKARARGQLNVRVHDLRDWTHDRHNTVDDTPYGGGPGMVMKPEPWGEALDAIIESGGGGRSVGDGEPEDAGGGAAELPALVVPTPSGRPFTQALAVELAERPWLVFAPARYEGIDRRVIDEYAERLDVYEISIGDYVLAGGEAAVLVITEAVARLLPGVLGNAESHRDDSFAPGAMADLLEGPVYTKPPQWRGRGIPEVLLSGHHGKVARWRRDEAFRRTSHNRPDLIERCDPAALDKHDRKLLAELGWEEVPVSEPDGALLSKGLRRRERGLDSDRPLHGVGDRATKPVEVDRGHRPAVTGGGPERLEMSEDTQEPGFGRPGQVVEE